MEKGDLVLTVVGGNVWHSSVPCGKKDSFGGLRNNQWMQTTQCGLHYTLWPVWTESCPVLLGDSEEPWNQIR